MTPDLEVTKTEVQYEHRPFWGDDQQDMVTYRLTAELEMHICASLMVDLGQERGLGQERELDR